MVTDAPRAMDAGEGGDGREQRERDFQAEERGRVDLLIFRSAALSLSLSLSPSLSLSLSSSLLSNLFSPFLILWAGILSAAAWCVIRETATQRRMKELRTVSQETRHKGDDKRGGVAAREQERLLEGERDER